MLGGGFAGLETAFLIHHRLHGEVDLTLVSDKPNFLFRPNTIYIPFGTDPDSLLIDLARPTQRQDIRFIEGTVVDLDPEAKRIDLADGKHLAYDMAVVATGADMRPAEIPGLAEHANTIWTPAQMLELRATVERIVAKGQRGEATRVLFLVPPNNKCSGPLYELVFMLETWLRRHDARDAVDITWATVESGYIQAFGPKLDEVVIEGFAEHGITGHKEKVAVEVTQSSVRFEDGSTLEYDELIAFPPYIARLSYAALPSDDRGFIATDFATRQVAGIPDVFAPGDAGDFPIKQAFLAFLQADAVAETIVGRVRDKEPRVQFDPVSLCVMERFDTATFAQVPVQLTGDPNRPVEVRPGQLDEYKVGTSPLWRLGKKMLGVYLPMRFRAGEPFHAGTAWQLMDVGLKGMSSVLAH